jgi:DNA-binding MarR family transcriptional regulator
MTPASTDTHTRTASVIGERRSSPGLLLALLGQEATERLRAAHTAHNLKPRQFHILGLLHDHGGLQQKELLAHMGIDPSILVTLLNPLEADGLVARERDPADRRRHLVTLTPAGGQQLAISTHAQQEAERLLLAPLDDRQREQLRGLLITLRDGLAVAPGTDCSESDTTT